jgi:hypothetical protein
LPGENIVAGIIFVIGHMIFQPTTATRCSASRALHNVCCAKRPDFLDVSSVQTLVTNKFGLKNFKSTVR